MKKKVGAVLLAGMMACAAAASVAIAGCGSARKPDFEMPEGGFDTSKDVTITFSHTMGAGLQNALNDAIAEFNLIYPNIHIEHNMEGNWGDLHKTISTKIQAGRQPNIAYCYADHVADYNVSEAVVPLDDFLPDGAYKDVKVSAIKLNEGGEQVLDENDNPVTEEVSFNLTQDEYDMYNPVCFKEGRNISGSEKLYAIPWAKSTEVMFYNKTFFDAHSERISVPTTWAEMEEVCKEIKAICTEENLSAVPFGYDSEENLFITQCEQRGTKYTAAEGDHFLFNNAENKAFVQTFKEWYDNDYFETGSLSGSDYTSTLFTEQKIFMSIGSTGGTTYNIDTSSGTIPFEVGIAPVPQMDSDPAHMKLLMQGPSVCIFKSDDPQKVMASWLFVKFCTTNLVYQHDVARNNGYMPVLKNEVMMTNPAYATWIDKANGKENLTALAVKVAMQYEDKYFTSPAFRGSAEAREQVGLLMQGVLTGNKTLDAAFNDAYTTCTNKYGK